MSELKNSTEASLGYFDFVVVTPGDEQGLLVVETNPSDGSVVFVEFLEQCAHPIVPKLDGAIVQADYKKNY
jgi:hypothetical protein